jgi:hypothetical protein
MGGETQSDELPSGGIRPIVDDLRTEVTNGTVSFDSYSSGSPDEITVPDIAADLVDTHNTESVGDLETNADFVGEQATKSDVVDALRNPRGYGATDWDAWGGIHRGEWYDTATGNSPFLFRKYHHVDGWMPPGRRPSSEYGSKDFRQPVYFYEETAGGKVDREGWNASNPDADHLWGWDPKNYPADFDPRTGYVGTHVGYPFSTGSTRWIVWLTPQEYFLECVAPTDDEAKRRRTSAGRWGYGQWTVSDWLSGLFFTSL